MVVNAGGKINALGGSSVHQGGKGGAGSVIKGQIKDNSFIQH